MREEFLGCRSDSSDYDQDGFDSVGASHIESQFDMGDVGVTLGMEDCLELGGNPFQKPLRLFVIVDCKVRELSPF